MSLATLPAPAGSGDEWDDFLEFAAVVEDFDRTFLPEPDFDGHRHPKRRARGAEERAAIDESLREGR